MGSPAVFPRRYLFSWPDEPTPATRGPGETNCPGHGGKGVLFFLVRAARENFDLRSSPDQHERLCSARHAPVSFVWKLLAGTRREGRSTSASRAAGSYGVVRHGDDGAASGKRRGAGCWGGESVCSRGGKGWSRRSLK